MPRIIRTRDEFVKLRKVGGTYMVVSTRMGYPAGGVHKSVNLENGGRATVSVVGKAAYLPAKSYEELCG